MTRTPTHHAYKKPTRKLKRDTNTNTNTIQPIQLTRNYTQQGSVSRVPSPLHRTRVVSHHVAPDGGHSSLFGSGARYQRGREARRGLSWLSEWGRVLGRARVLVRGWIVWLLVVGWVPWEHMIQKKEGKEGKEGRRG